jgi:hypothetical protein
MKKPFTVKVIKLLAWFGLLACLLAISLMVYAVDGPELENDFARGIRAGALRVVARALGSAPDRVSRFDAYTIVGGFLPPMLLYAFVLRSISKRWILSFRIAATVALLVGLGAMNVSGMALNGVPFVIIGVLAWLPPVTRYLKSG